MNIKENIYYIVRNYVKKYLTGNLGRVIEEETRLICYVDKNKLSKMGGQNKFACFGITDKDATLAKAYHLNKPICYIFEGLEFSKPVDIYGYDCQVYINDCEFTGDCYIRINGKCTIEATDFKPYDYLKISANEITIQDLCMNENNFVLAGTNINIDANDNLEIVGCTITNENKKGSINLHSDNKLVVEDSLILANVVNCTGKEILQVGNTLIRSNFDNSLIRTLNKN